VEGFGLACRVVALLDVVLDYDCNLACDYCTISPQMRRRALSTAQVLRAFDEGRALGYDAVSFTGGEPTIRPDLVGLVRQARARGYRDVKVQSNGLMYAHGPNVDRLVAAGVDRFHVSIHTHEPARYDQLVRRADSHPLMVAGLDALVARGLAPIADVILKEDTYRALPDALAWLHGRGVREAQLWFVSLTDGNRDNVASMPRMTDVVPVMATAFAWARARAMEVRSLHVPRCLLGADAAHALDPGGGDRVRVVTPDATFELSDSRLGGSRYVAACDGCEHRAVCRGIRPDYLARYGDREIIEARARAAGGVLR
jgi:molybdenum cofactor biosynthesis enzyme MoaA